MTEIEPNLLPRREFLRGVIGVAGAVALGLEVSSATAEAVHTEAVLTAAPLAVAYWNGTRLVDARHLASGDAALCNSGVRLKVLGHSGGDALRAINAHFSIQTDGTEQYAPFHAWTGNGQGSSASFTMPIAGGKGILLSALHEGKETFIRLHANSASGQPKLRSGLYVLATGQPHWAGCHFDPDALSAGHEPLTRRTLGGFLPVSFGYRVFSIERA